MSPEQIEAWGQKLEQREREREAWLADLELQWALDEIIAREPERLGPPTRAQLAFKEIGAAKRKLKAAHEAGDKRTVARLQRKIEVLVEICESATPHNLFDAASNLTDARLKLRKADSQDPLLRPLADLASDMDTNRYDPLFQIIVHSVLLDLWQRRDCDARALRLLEGVWRALDLLGESIVGNFAFGHWTAQRPWRTKLPEEYPCFRRSRDEIEVFRTRSIRVGCSTRWDRHDEPVFDRRIEVDLGLRRPDAHE